MKMIKVINSMPPQVQNRFKVLHMLSDERSRINDAYEEELKQLQDKFNEKKRPILEKRNEIVKGTCTDFSELTAQYEENFKEISTIVAGITKSAKDKERDEEEAKDHVATNVDHLKEVQGVPDFWSTAIKNN